MLRVSLLVSSPASLPFSASPRKSNFDSTKGKGSGEREREPPMPRPVIFSAFLSAGSRLNTRLNRAIQAALLRVEGQRCCKDE